MAPPRKQTRTAPNTNRITNDHLERTKILVDLARKEVEKYALATDAKSQKRYLIYAKNFLSKAEWNMGRAIESLLS